MFALWLYATLEGVGSGREVARLALEHDAYRWICGGVSVNYHAINDFRAGNETLMDELLTDNVASLAAVGAISPERVAQDGMRVRADAGAASFRRQASLDEHLSQASELVQTIKARAQADPGRGKRRAQAAKLRAALEREERIRAALEQLPEVAAAKKRNGSKAEARASTTDADSRVMKMGDGGFRPAYNVQFATTCEEQIIVGMDVVTAGSDMAQLAPMVGQVEQRLGRSPDEWLVDGGFPAHEQIDAVVGKTEVYAPVPEPGRRRTSRVTRSSRTSTSPSPMTPRRWPNGERAWPAMRPRKSTSSARQRPNASTHKRATEDCCACPCVAWPRSARWWACSCWRTTCCAWPCSHPSSSVGAQVHPQWPRRPHERARNGPKALSAPQDREPGTNLGHCLRNSTTRAGDPVKHRQQSRQSTTEKLTASESPSSSLPSICGAVARRQPHLRGRVFVTDRVACCMRKASSFWCRPPRGPPLPHGPQDCWEGRTRETWVPISATNDLIKHRALLELPAAHRRADLPRRAPASNLGVSKADRDIALAQYEQSIQAGFREVADALASSRALAAQRAALEAQVAVATQAQDLSRARYDAGADSFLVLLDAQRTLYSAQQALVATRLAEQSKRVTLYKAVGGGWKERT